MISCCRQVSCSVASLEKHMETWQKLLPSVRMGLGTQDLWLKGHQKPTERYSLMLDVFYSFIFKFLTLHHPLGCWPPPPGHLSRLHPAGGIPFALFFPSDSRAGNPAFAIWNHHQFGRKIHQKPRGRRFLSWEIGSCMPSDPFFCQRLCSQSKMPIPV